MRNLIFMSYSHQDKACLEELRGRLELRIPRKHLQLWVDTDIKTGEKFEKIISEAVRSAKIAVLLVSEAFLHSDFIRRYELNPLVEAAKNKETTLIWIAVGKSQYKLTALETVNAANDPERPLDSLDHDEREVVLADICRKIILAVEEQERRRPLSYYLNYIPFAAIIAAGVPALAAYLTSKTELGTIAVRALLVWLGISVGWIIGLGFYAYKAFSNNRPIPAPETFWHLIFDKLATAVGRTEQLLIRLKVLIVCDASTESTLRQIEEAYQGKYLDIEGFICPVDLGKKGKDLERLLKQSNALYLFRTEETENSEQLREVIKRWEVEETHKPIFAVDFLPDDYRWPYTRIPAAQAIPGIWKLLAHGNERANLWRAQAKTYRQFFFGAGILSVTVIALLIFALIRTGPALSEKERELVAEASRSSAKLQSELAAAKKELEVRDRFNESTLRDNLWTELEKSSLSLKSLRPPEVGEALKTYAGYSLMDLLERQDKTHHNYELTFWRKFAYGAERKEYICQVAASNGRGLICFPSNKSTIIKCSTERKQFVLWREHFSNNDKAAWTLDGTPNAHYNSGSDAIEFESTTPYTCHFEERKMTRDGLICLGIGGTPPSPEHESGVCLSVAKGGSPADTEFFANGWTRNYLLRTVSVMKLIPDDLLRTPGVLAALQETVETEKREALQKAVEREETRRR